MHKEVLQDLVLFYSSIEKKMITVKGPKGSLTRDIHNSVNIEQKDNEIYQGF